MNRDLDKYLKNYSEPDIEIASWCFEEVYAQKIFDQVVVVPLYAEKDHILDLLKSLNQAAQCCQQEVIVILLVNHTPLSSTDVVENNAQTLSLLESGMRHLQLLNGKFHASTGGWNTLNLLIVKKNQKNHLIPSHQGVGLARKIACDIAYFAWKAGNISSPFAFTTDADAIVPEDYFQVDQALTSNDSVSALLFDFIHSAHPSLDPYERRALKSYEYYLNYYESGLTYAQSSYGYTSIGSTICFSFKKYAQVRGFPKKTAGEDFYFLNKLRKVGSIHKLKNHPITLSGRISTRVPFGTGQSVKSISELYKKSLPYKIYHPSVFVFLKTLLSEVERFFSHEDLEDLKKTCFQNLLATKSCSKKQVDEAYKTFQTCIFSSDFEKHLLDILHTSKTYRQRSYQFFIWFDALKTLKMIHQLRDHFFPSIPEIQTRNFTTY